MFFFWQEEEEEEDVEEELEEDAVERMRNEMNDVFDDDTNKLEAIQVRILKKMILSSYFRIVY